MNLRKTGLWKALFFCLLLAGAQGGASAETESPKPAPLPLPTRDIYESPADRVEAVADQLEYSRDSKKITAKGNVVVRYRDQHITCDVAEIDTDAKTVHAEGHVIIFHKEQPVAQGTEVDYNFGTKSGTFPDGKAFTAPWFVSGKSSEQLSDEVRRVQGGTATTCNLEKPHFEIKGRTIKVIEDDKMIIKNAVIYVLGKPVFWLPYFIVPLDQETLPFTVSAGYKSRFGYYIETSKGFSVNKNIHGKMHLDYRTERGVGGGADFDYDYGKWAQGIVKGYVTQDRKAPSTAIGNNSDDPSDFHNTRSRTRGRATWVHRTDIDDYTNVILRYNKIEDEYFLQEFFQKESRAEMEPQSFVTATKNSQRWGSLVHVEKAMNRFESPVEKLPHVQLDWRDQRVKDLPLFYKSQISYSNLQKEFGRRRPDEEHVQRFDQYNELSAPLQWSDVKFTPFVSLREDYFTRNLESASDRFRVTMSAGADLRTQFYKTYDVSFDKAGIELNDIRHIMEPVAQYQTDKPTMNPGRLGNFDSVDRIDDSDRVIVGLENRFQTKRIVDGRMRRVDFVSLNTYLNYQRLDDPGNFTSNLTNSFEGRTESTYYSNDLLLNQEVALRPYEWLQYEARLDHSVKYNEFRSFNQELIAKIRRFKFLFAHRYLKNIGDLQGGNQFGFETKWVINPLWTVGGYIRWDAEREGRDEYQVAFTRDLHDFLLDFGYNVRNSSIDSSNKEVFFNFRLKAFPALNLRTGSRAEFAEPRIGPTVAGAQTGAIQDFTYYENY